jgi:hypothetical protein
MWELDCLRYRGLPQHNLRAIERNIERGNGRMNFVTVALAVSLLIGSAGFTSSFAQTAAVSEKTFDWIFFAIVFIPFLLGLIQLAKPDWLEPLIRRRSRD